MSDQLATPSPVSTGLTTSTEIGELAKALANAHKDFKPVLKDANNPFFKSKYADLAGVIESTSDALSKNGLVVIQSPRLSQNKVAVTTLLAHSSGQWLRDELELPMAKFDAQGAGSAITYARRYAYQAIVSVAAEDDDGNAASQKFEKQADGSFAKNPPPPPQKTPETVQKPVEVKKPGRPKKESVPDAGKPWGGAFEPKTETTPGSPVTTENIHGVTDLTDADVPLPMDDRKEDRLPTEEEAKNFRERLIAVKDRGYAGLGQWIIKTSGKPRTQDIPFAVISKLVEQVEAAEKAGKLKELLA